MEGHSGGKRLPQCEFVIEAFQKHIDESGPVRDAVARHDAILTDLVSLKRWLQGTLVGILGVAVLWGALVQKVNTLERDMDRHIYGNPKTGGTIDRNAYVREIQH